MINDSVAGRAYGRVYAVQGKSDMHQFLVDAVAAAGGRVLYASDASRAPIYLGVQAPRDERVGVLAYPFRSTHRVIENRPVDEHRIQIRYGGEASWQVEEDHVLGRDLAGVDTTLVLGVDLDAQLLIGLDPSLYDPLPMGISIEFKNRDVAAAQGVGWHVIERENRGGRRRLERRAPSGLETIVLFRPERLLDYVRLERQASDLGLDSALRFAAAAAASTPSTREHQPGVFSLHALESEFDLTSEQILEIIATRNRLSVAVRGGVAEFHLERALKQDPGVAQIRRLDEDGRPDFELTMADGRQLVVECKNASPKALADGTLKVEVQKTRASKGDPASRFYPVDHFDVIAACLYSPRKEWTFRFELTSRLERHRDHPDRLAPIQRIGRDWASDLGELR